MFSLNHQRRNQRYPSDGPQSLSGIESIKTSLINKIELLVNNLSIFSTNYCDVEASKLCDVCSLQRRCLINASWYRREQLLPSLLYFVRPN
jgi:hypothetical protein